MTDEGRKTSIGIWIAVGGTLLVAVIAVGASLAAYGVRKYMANVRQQEARTALVTWAGGLVGCGQREKHLPATSSPVPANLSDVQAKKWQSTPADWQEPAFSCAGFSLSAPQYYQYHWQSRGPELGVATAVADLDGDGLPEDTLSIEVHCSAGSCTAGHLVGAAEPARPSGETTSSEVAAQAESASEAPRGLAPPEVAALILSCICVLAFLFGSVWLTVAAFQVSAGWGVATLLLPCARLGFVVQYWQRAKKPFLLQVASVGVFIVGGVLSGALSALAAPRGSVPAAAPSVTLARPSTPPPLPSVVVPPMTGDAVDLSSVMGRARKLANAWQPEAALLGIEATLADGKIQAQDGASAKLTFGPSAFDVTGARAGLFVVVYDKSGLKGAPVAGKPGKALPEPMCAPERVLSRVPGLQGPVTLRYGLDAAQRPLWSTSSPANPKDISAFDPQDCSAVALPRRQR